MANLQDIANKMVAGGRGILAADESSGTIKKRFDSIDVTSTEDKRRDYREMLFRTPDALKSYISGVILFDETLRQSAADGTRLATILEEADCLPGIKVDEGAKDHDGHDGEKLTDGLDGLPDRLAEYRDLGATFAKWRAVIGISDTLPTDSNVRANAERLAAYAKACQDAGIVPIVEPEVTMDGDPGTHSIARCEEVTDRVLAIVFEEQAKAGVALDGIILKPNMVIDGSVARQSNPASVDEVAERTVRVLKARVPSGVPGIAFLSGGQSDVEATAHLNAMNTGYDTPFALTFSYGRALQAASLQAWRGQDANVSAAQTAFAHRARMNHLAALGKWSMELEEEASAA